MLGDAYRATCWSGIDACSCVAWQFVAGHLLTASKHIPPSQFGNLLIQRICE